MEQIPQVHGANPHSFMEKIPELHGANPPASWSKSPGFMDQIPRLHGVNPPNYFLKTIHLNNYNISTTIYIMNYFNFSRKHTAPHLILLRGTELISGFNVEYKRP